MTPTTKLLIAIGAIFLSVIGTMVLLSMSMDKSGC